MRIAVDADFGQLYQSRISSVPIDGFHKLACHLKAHTSVLITEVLRGRFGNIVAEIEDDGDFRKPFELFH